MSQQWNVLLERRSTNSIQTIELRFEITDTHSMPIETKGLKFLVRALGSRNFRLFFFGQAVSLIGTWMQLIAMRWLVYRLTNPSWV
jgi:hypothetical protein